MFSSLPKPKNFISAYMLFFASVATGKELKWTHYGSRPLAMGNAYVAVADDYNAIFYNPAGLARIQSWSFEILNPRLGISANTVATIQDVRKLYGGAASDSTGKGSIQPVLDIFQSLTGKPQYIALGWTPHFVMQNFGFGLGVDVGGSLVVHRQISADVDAGVDVLAPIGYGRSFLEDRLSLGATIKGVLRTGVDREFSLADISAFTDSDEGSGSDTKLKDYVQSGKGVGADFGLMFTPVKTMEPTFGVSITDIGGTPLKSTSDTYGKPAPRQPALNTGVSFRPYNSGSMYVLTA
ncbi:MAG: hypothetical protein NTV34_21480, partial [Proteobacteria bacterium]|nr:hypothetical protein [Pseudomonadota bacterium]